MDNRNIVDCLFVVAKSAKKLIKKKFGKKAADNIIEMTKIKLKRKIKGD